MCDANCIDYVGYQSVSDEREFAAIPNTDVVGNYLLIAGKEGTAPGTLTEYRNVMAWRNKQDHAID